MDNKIFCTKSHLEFLENPAKLIKQAESAHLKAADVRIVRETLNRFAQSDSGVQCL